MEILTVSDLDVDNFISEDKKHELDGLLNLYMEKKKMLDEVIEIEKRYENETEGQGKNIGE